MFGYYSGQSNRMEVLFELHQDRFYTDLIKSVEKPLRPLLYARHIHSQFALLAFFYEKDKVIMNFLKEYLAIESFDSVLFIIKEPPWNSKDGDARFWNARGSVQQLLSKLYDLSIAPMRMEQDVRIDFRKRSKLEHLYLYIKDIKTLEELSEQYASPQEFFKALESTYISKLISEVRIRVKIRKKDDSLTFSELSEGEQQLLMVLGLLRFTKEDESLFLLDEPDTHLNPAWSVGYLKILRDVVGEQKTSQIIMTTHDPLMISSLTRFEVIIVRLDNLKNQFIAEHPEKDPIKMGYPEIITSELFNLRSIVNPLILNLLDKKRVLASKEILNEDESQTLDSLNRQLDEFDFTNVIRDPLYDQFVRAMTLIENEMDLQKVALTKEQQDYRKKLAIDILRKIKNDTSREV